MSKNEIARFKIRYKIFSKTDSEKIGVWLSNAVDFDRPDGYYYDAENKLLVIFEHFDIDCSERIIKNGKSNGSILRKNIHDEYQQVPICSIGIGQKEKRRNRFSYAVRLCFYLVFWVLYGKNRGFQPILLHTLIVTRGR